MYEIVQEMWLTSSRQGPTFPRMQTLGERLKIYRESAGLTQRRLGELMGRAASEIYRWEQGIVRIPAEELPRLAAVLGVSVVAFFEEPEGVAQINWRLHAAAQGLDEATIELVVGLLQRLKRHDLTGHYTTQDE